ncbi:RhoGAP-domain-containing protein [Dacryopinax primogenitus]|uniref:RhoGAP-domain-containing protein n=1 Tax=Dacryopinax primogenitus (strain DJM 731) TaxID=1858805 RepID=M5G573_DACPD|nr:RhoGAP-domain-containing protein [Dacryopinax primogenitus]EJU00982.1 RhoGAP-domain-containing protein [Dacryopinax primogenitus]
MSNDLSQPGPVPWFDHHLKVLNDSYIAFFQERAKLEENYVEALFKLCQRAKNVDSQLDRIETSSTRLAWREVTGELEREATTRGAFIESIRQDVLAPLSAFKETQERTRKRIKEDSKESYQRYQEMAESTLPRLKRNYIKKCQDVEDHRAQERAIEMQKQLLSNPLAAPTGPGGSLSNVPMAPQAISPIPLPPSAGLPTQRARSPSGSGGFSDLAQHGKKQFGQFMNFLNERRDVREGNGPVNKDMQILPIAERGSGPMRSVKAKREAEEADKEYRKGVFRLETLRLRREKILLAGYTSLEEFVKESAEVVKGVLRTYADGLEATGTANASLSRDLQHSVGSITPAKDASLVRAAVPNAMARALPKRVLYWNYSVGECNDLMFGVSLVDYATARSLADGEAPDLIMKCIEEVEERGLDSEGIYRVSGRHATVQELMRKIERNEDEFRFNPLLDDIYTICSLLKLYLRELPEPVFRFSLPDRLQYSDKREEHVSNNFLVLKSKLRRLPSIHQATLRVIVEHLAKVAGRSSQNKMDAKNLSLIFGPVVFGEDDMPKNGDVLSVGTTKDTLMEDLITFAPLVFSDQPAPSPTRPQSPPLPSKPENEEPAAGPRGNPYGTEHSSFVLIPPREKDAPTIPTQSGMTSSIHPSNRIQNSPTDALWTQGEHTVGIVTTESPPHLSSEPTASDEDRTVLAHSLSSSDSVGSTRSALTPSPSKSQRSSSKSQRTSPLNVTTALVPQSVHQDCETVSPTSTTPVTGGSFQSTKTSFSIEASASPGTDSGVGD